MELMIRILRTDKKTKAQYMQSVLFDTERLGEGKEDATIASLLNHINADNELTDTEGKRVGAVGWECGCLQKKCGACAMRINKRPSLACGVKLRDLKGKSILLEPLMKFPVVHDLIVDRSVLYKNLTASRQWMHEAADAVPEQLLKNDIREDAYEASKCLQCGCCVEVCPNFYAGGDFSGTAAAIPKARLFALSGAFPEEERKRMRKDYNTHFFEGCAKSLSCRDICPAGIDVDGLLVKNTAYGRR